MQRKQEGQVTFCTKCVMQDKGLRLQPRLWARVTNTATDDVLLFALGGGILHQC